MDQLARELEDLFEETSVSSYTVTSSLKMTNMKKSSLRVSWRRGAEPECVFSACVCLFPACGGWCHADIFQSSTSASIQCE